MASFGATLFGGFNPDLPNDEPVTQRQLTGFMTSYYTVTSNLNTVITDVITQQQAAFAQANLNAQENKDAIVKIFESVTALTQGLDASVGQHKSALGATLSQALVDIGAKCEASDKALKELETHLKTWTEEHEEHLKKWAEKHETRMGAEMVDSKAEYAKEFSAKLDAAQAKFDNSLNKMSGLLESTRGASSGEGGAGNIGFSSCLLYTSPSPRDSR